jgi:hypothetical protein
VMADNFTPRVKAILRDPLPSPAKRPLAGEGREGGRHGKGDHEIWHSPISNRRFMVDNNNKSRDWANYTLKQAGLPKAF